jgi:hypothetical protein
MRASDDNWPTDEPSPRWLYLASRVANSAPAILKLKTFPGYLAKFDLMGQVGLGLQDKDLRPGFGTLGQLLWAKPAGERPWARGRKKPWR